MHGILKENLIDEQRLFLLNKIMSGKTNIDTGNT